jgi:hypothetical protein
MHNLIVKFLNQVAFVVRFVPFVVTGHKMYSYVCEGVSVVSLLVLVTALLTHCMLQSAL